MTDVIKWGQSAPLATDTESVLPHEEIAAGLRSSVVSIRLQVLLNLRRTRDISSEELLRLAITSRKRTLDTLLCDFLMQRITVEKLCIEAEDDWTVASAICRNDDVASVETVKMYLAQLQGMIQANQEEKGQTLDGTIFLCESVVRLYCLERGMNTFMGHSSSGWSSRQGKGLASYCKVPALGL